MNQINCEIIQDLLPLYCDGVCSPESKRIVEEHLNSCSECRAALAMFREPIVLPEAGEELNSAKAASRAWKLGRRNAFRLGAIITMILVAVCVICFAGLHFVKTENQNNVSGLVKQLESYAELSPLHFAESTQKGDVMVLACSDDNGRWYVGVYRRDLLFSNRWKIEGSLSNVKPGKLANWNYKTPNGGSILVCFGAKLADDISGYTFTNSGITYISPVEDASVLDIYFVTDAYDSSTYLQPIYMNEE